MTIIDPITGERVTLPARTIATADQACAVCHLELDHEHDALAFGPDAAFVHAGGCADIAWGRSDSIACDGNCGTLLADGDGETCPVCETEGPLCSYCHRHHHGERNSYLDHDTFIDEDCRFHDLV